MEPITRQEIFMAAAAGDSIEVPEPITREEMYLKRIAENGGGSGGTTNYNSLSNKPKINNVELSGNKTSSDLGILNSISVNGVNQAISAGGSVDLDVASNLITDAQWSALETLWAVS